MKRNVEIKARVDDLASMTERVRTIADGPGVVLRQTDTFFKCRHGRLKLRVFPEGEAELIRYNRDPGSQPRESRYQVVRCAEPEALHDALAEGLGITGTVRKTRTLYKVGPTRIHLDEVEGLGSFLELEVVLASGQPVEEGRAIAEDLMRTLGIAEESLLDRAYIDLLSAGG